MTSTAEVALRLAVAPDAAAIAMLSRDLVESGLPWSWTPRRVLAAIRDPDVNVLVAAARVRVAGFGVMRYGLAEAHLELLGVSPGWRRAGVGRRIVTWLEQTAAAGGAPVVWLEVRAGEGGALTFYERLGYRRVAELPGYYWGLEDAVRMGRELDSARAASAWSWMS